MTTRLEVTLRLRSDFHVGTGAGRGRVVDAAVARDRDGRPLMPGSTLKGLAREQAERLAALRGSRWSGDTVTALFGSRGRQAGKLRFGAACPVKAWPEPVPVGRSARDRRTGRARDGALFREEVAAAQDLVAEVVAPDGLDDGEAVLLAAALRRIEALGRARARGRGAVSVIVRILDGPFQGAQIPEHPGALEDALKSWLGLGAAPAPRQATATRGGASAPAPSCTGPLAIVARALDPLVLPASPETGNVTRSLGYVPGATLRGAVAAAALRAGWDPDGDDFQDAFVRDAVAFGPLFPALDPWNVARSVPFPTPLSLATCRRHPGTAGDGSTPGAHGAVDLLQPAEPRETCGVDGCAGPLEAMAGIVQCEHDEVRGGPVPRAVDAAPRVRMHVSLRAGRAVEGELYAHEEVPEGSVLVGLAWGKPELLGAVRALLDGAEVSVGKARSRGAGRLRVSAREAPGGVLPAPGSSDEGFTLTLYSDLVAVDPLLRPLVRMDEVALWGLLGGEGDPPFALVRGYARARRVASFNGLPGRPRTADVALVAGSCWRYRWTDPGRVGDARALLHTAADSGLGLRRGEGFGRVVVDHPLHDVGLDQTRAKSPTIPLTTWTPSVPGAAAAVGRARTPPSTAFDIAQVRDADHVGLARLLLRAAGAEDPRSVLRGAAEARGDRDRPETGTDRWLRGLLDQRLDQPSARRKLQATAEALLRGGGR